MTATPNALFARTGVYAFACFFWIMCPAVPAMLLLSAFFRWQLFWASLFSAVLIYSHFARRLGSFLVQTSRSPTCCIDLDPSTETTGYLLAFPHFSFTDPWITHDTSRVLVSGSNLLIAPLMYWTSPAWFCRTFSGERVDFELLSGNSIRTLLDRKKPFMISPGGFIEASGITSTREVLYAGALGYHLTQARRFGVAITVLLVYDANPIIVNVEAFAALRMFLARRGVPLVIPDIFHMVRSILRPSTEKVFLRRVAVDVDMHETTLAELILETYKSDAAALLRDHGVSMRTPEIHFRDSRRKPLR